MADTKITALTALTAADPANDVLPIVDVSDTTMAASGTTKKISVNNILGCSGTATLASATITGDLTVDTSTLKVDSANDRVGIGTAAPSQFVHLSKSNTSTALTAPPAGGASLRIQNTSSTTNNFGSVEFYNAAGLFGASINCQYTNQSTPTNDLVFVVRGSSGGLEAARLDSSGNLGLGVTPTAGAGVLQLSSGINFPATQVASANANTLDDYEEGTFTPTVIGSGVAGTGTYTSQNARYTKVGRLVTVEVYINWTAHTGTGNLQLGGLPFSCNPDVYGSATFGFINNIAYVAGTSQLTGYIGVGSTHINLYSNPVGGGPVNAVTMDTSGDIIYSATYTV